MVGNLTMYILIVICAITTFGVVNSITAQIGDTTEDSFDICSPYFNRFAAPPVGYKRYMDNTTCSSIDYPENWIVKDPGGDAVLTDGQKTSVTISQRLAVKDGNSSLTDNSNALTLNDVSKAIDSHDTSIPTLASIPGLYDFPFVMPAGECANCTLDNIPTLYGGATSDLGYTKVYRSLYATIFPAPYVPELYVLTFNTDGNESELIRNMVESVRILH